MFPSSSIYSLWSRAVLPYMYTYWNIHVYVSLPYQLLEYENNQYVFCLYCYNYIHVYLLVWRSITNDYMICATAAIYLCLSECFLVQLFYLLTQQCPGNKLIIIVRKYQVKIHVHGIEECTLRPRWCLYHSHDKWCWAWITLLVLWLVTQWTTASFVTTCLVTTLVIELQWFQFT